MNFKPSGNIIILYFLLGCIYPLKSMATLVGLEIDSIPALRQVSRTKILNKTKNNDIEEIKHFKSDSDIDPNYYLNLEKQLEKFLNSKISTSDSRMQTPLEYKLYEEEHNELVYNSEDEILGIKVHKEKRGLESQVKNYSRNQDYYSKTANYIKNKIIKNNVSPEDLQSQKKLLTKLSKDAILILEEVSEDSKSRTVTFCVVLKDRNNHLKKFAFYNGETTYA